MQLFMILTSTTPNSTTATNNYHIFVASKAAMKGNQTSLPITPITDSCRKIQIKSHFKMKGLFSRTKSQRQPPKTG